jgi:integrase
MPPSSAQAAQIIESAWEQDDECGMFVWLTMVTGMHRTELLGLRWQHVDLGRDARHPPELRLRRRQGEQSAYLLVSFGRRLRTAANPRT